MGDIIHLDIPTEDPNEFLRSLPESVGEPVTAVIFTAKLATGEWMSGWCAGVGTMQEGLGHLQADVIDRMIRANTERYGLHTHN